MVSLNQGNYMRSEIVQDMNINDYHQHAGISNSGMKLILDCPARYYAEYFDPNAPQKEKKDCFEIGKSVHTLILESDLWHKSVYVMPKCDRRTTKGKELYEYHLHMACGRTLIDEQQHAQVIMMAQSIHRGLPWLKDALKDARIEESFFWVDEESGAQLKSRPDAYTEDFYIDLKTTQSASIGDFTRSIATYGYHMQAAMAREALYKLKGIKYSHFIYVVVEQVYPYLSAAFCLDEDFLEKGHKMFKSGAMRYAECLKTNQWPSYGASVQQIYMPPWLK